MDIDDDFGTFDYIIIHGIWSWVPDIVKDKILSICNRNLSDRGIAYVSYNTYPGWKRLEQIRDIMLYSETQAKKIACKNVRFTQRMCYKANCGNHEDGRGKFKNSLVIRLIISIACCNQ